MKTMKKMMALALAGCMAFAMTACGGGSSSGSSDKETKAAAETEAAGGEEGGAAGGTFKLGHIGPLTGAASLYGLATDHGAAIAVEEINAMGGDIQFELNSQDDVHDAETSVNAYNNLKDWGMQMLVGTTTTTPCIAVAAETNSDRMFEITPSASSPTVTEGKDNVFQMCFTDPNQGTASAKYIFDQKLGEKIAVIYNVADAYSTGIYQKFMEEAKTLGLDVVSESSFTDDNATDFSTQVNEAKNAGADLIFLPMYYQPASLILDQANKMGYTPKFFGVDGMDGILDMEGFNKELAEGVMLLTPFVATADDEMTKSFVAKYEEKYGETPIQFAADAYDCVYAIYAAIQASGVTADMSADEICEKMIATFTSGDFTVDGLTGSGMTWSANGEVAKDPKGMVIENGVYQPLD